MDETGREIGSIDLPRGGRRGEIKRKGTERARGRHITARATPYSSRRIGRDSGGLRTQPQLYAMVGRGKLCARSFIIRSHKPAWNSSALMQCIRRTRLIYIHTSFFYQPFRRRPYKLSILGPATSRSLYVSPTPSADVSSWCWVCRGRPAQHKSPPFTPVHYPPGHEYTLQGPTPATAALATLPFAHERKRANAACATGYCDQRYRPKCRLSSERSGRAAVYL